MEKQGKWDEFKRELDRLYAKGDFVVLVDCAVDEIYLFEVPADAERFYAEDYKAMECITVGDEEGMGFQEVSLYSGRRRVATKDSPPSKNVQWLKDSPLTAFEDWDLSLHPEWNRPTPA
jgi:hypothetical protein